MSLIKYERSTIAGNEAANKAIRKCDLAAAKIAKKVGIQTMNLRPYQLRGKFFISSPLALTNFFLPLRDDWYLKANTTGMMLYVSSKSIISIRRKYTFSALKKMIVSIIARLSLLLCELKSVIIFCIKYLLVDYTTSNSQGQSLLHSRVDPRVIQLGYMCLMLNLSRSK